MTIGKTESIKPPIPRIRNVFVVGHGQQDNIGDSVLRRAMISAVRGDDVQLHVLTSGNDDNFVEALAVQSTDRVYASRRLWVAAGVRACFSGTPVFVFNAGEVQLSWRFAYRSLAEYFLAVLFRLRGAELIHTGVGIRSGEANSMVIRRLMRTILVGRRGLVTWRDISSQSTVGVGRVEPDWAFSEGAPIQDLRGTLHDRSVLAISMRGDGPSPSARWIAAIRDLGDALNLQVVVVVQVERDHELAVGLAKRLDAHFVPFSEHSHASQERLVRSVYRNAAVVISDRLHALVIGVTEGALPVAISEIFPEKTDRTMRGAGFMEMYSSTSAAVNVDELRAKCEASLQSEDLLSALAQARVRLTTLKGEIRLRIA